MSAEDAAYRLAHRYPGGVPALAVRMHRNPSTLQNELNPNVPSHKLGLADAELMTALTGDAEIAQAMAMACGHLCIPVAPVTQDADLAQRIASTGKEFGDVMHATLQAIADGRVTSRELGEFDHQFSEFLGASVALRARLAAMVPSRPAELRVAK